MGNTNQDAKPNQKQVETGQTLDDDLEHHIVKHPYVVIIGISTYDKPQETLRAVPADVAKMKQLWLEKFKYDKNYVSIITEEIGSEYICIKDLNKYLNNVASKIQLGLYGKTDALIVIYSGHGGSNGLDNHIITSDNGILSITEIQNRFSSKNCDYLDDKPKILYFDCCRGNEIIRDQQIQQKKGAGKTGRYINELSDFYIHFATSQNNISWGKNEKDGSHFIFALFNCYRNNYQKHISTVISLHESSIIINQMVNESNKGRQTCEVIDRLTYNVFIQPNILNPSTHIIPQRNKLVTSINSLDNQLKQEKKNYSSMPVLAECDIKLVLLGNTCVGKTTLFNQKIYGEPTLTKMTVSAYFQKCEFTINNKIYEVSVWDTAGEERYHALTKIYTRGAHCAIIMYDITSHKSWKAVATWIDELDTDSCAIIILGNKQDIVDKHPNKRQILFDEVETFARDKGCLCMEGSALSGKNVNEMFESVIRKYIDRIDELNGDTTKETVKLDRKKHKSTKESLCC